MFFVYILRSESTAHLYTGYTEDVTQRLGQHNEGLTKSTKNRGTWKLVHSEEFATRAEAMRREKFLKSGQGRSELRRILGPPPSSVGLPAIETPEKMARALEVPMYRLFHDGDAPASLRKFKPPKDDEFGSTGGEAVYLSKLRRLLAKMEPGDQKLVLHMAQKVARD